MSELGPEWVPDQDGVPYRKAARVVIFDADGRILLASGHDSDQPERHWWFTIGGGLEGDEDTRQAAVREVFEETGIRLDVEQLVGPVLFRRAFFHFLQVDARQDEWFYLARTHTTNLSHQGWTDLERDVLDEQRWWTLDDLAQAVAAGIELYPRDLLSRARQWLTGWDGRLATLQEE